MTTGIKGPSGPGGPTGPAGADDLPDVDRADRAGQAVQAGRADQAVGAGQAAGASGPGSAAGASGADPMVALAADLDAGRVSPDDALARLLDEGLGADLEPGQRAELEALFADLLATDPYLAGLARDLGASPADDGPPVAIAGDGGEPR